MEHSPKILIWNVCGLNAHARRTAVGSLVVTANASLVCLQETKMALIGSSTVLEALGSEFGDYVYLPALATRGGILLARKSREIVITDPLFTANALTTRVSTPAGASTPWWITVVYGPQPDEAKIAFLQELCDIRMDCTGPWMICGDFNLIYRDEDKNNGSVNRRMMGRFQRTLNDLALKEVYLKGRCYTWSNEQSSPTLVHLDRVLCTADWEELHGECHLRCLASVVSDHSPLLLDCSPVPPTHRRFRFKDFWTHTDGFHDTVEAAWQSVSDIDPFRHLMLRMQATAHGLTSWSAKRWVMCASSLRSLRSSSSSSIPRKIIEPRLLMRTGCAGKSRPPTLASPRSSGLLPGSAPASPHSRTVTPTRPSTTLWSTGK